MDGKQYKVSEGETLEVDKLGLDDGASVDFDQVLLVNSGSDLKIGQPVVAGAKVSATVEKNYKDKKVLVYKYKRKKAYRKTKGHRQQLTRIKIDKIAA